MSYIQYVNVLHSKKTKEKYTEFLNAFLTYADIGCDEILQMETKQVQSLLIQYIIDMRDKMKLAPNSMKVRLASSKDISSTQALSLAHDRLTIIRYDFLFVILTS